MSRSDPLAFLGEEFLTWLWFRIETDGGEFDIGRQRELAVSFDDFLAFAPRDDDETEHILRKGTPSRSVEASAALRNGRRLTRARLIIAHGDAVYGVIIDGPTMDLLSVKLPDDDPEAASAEERSAERIAGFTSLREYVARLYELFLRERLEPDYLDTGGAEQATWMATH
jgi:hypothetical protein